MQNIDLWLQILEYLPVTSIQNTATLSTEFHKHVYQSEIIWNFLLTRDFSHQQLTTVLNPNDTYYNQFKCLYSFYKGTIDNFDDYLPETLVRGVYSCGLEKVTKVQQYSYLPIRAGLDVMVQSGGSVGKTTAYVIAGLSQIDTSKTGTQVLIICPTREISYNVAALVKDISQFMNVTTKILVGGTSIQTDGKELKENVPQIVIGTTGRISDMVYRTCLDLSQVNTIFFDQMDSILDMGFANQIDHLIETAPSQIQICANTSKTSGEVQRFCSLHMRNPYHVTIDSEKPTPDGTRHFNVDVQEDTKLDTLKELLETFRELNIIIFCYTKRNVEWLAEQLNTTGIPVSVLHQGLQSTEKLNNYNDFRTGRSKFLIVTDLAVRGLEISFAPLHINYDLPTSVEMYFYRIGPGHIRRKIAINLVTSANTAMINALQQYLNFKELPDDISKLII
jgi:superfamily II DNA/RNA helicase